MIEITEKYPFLDTYVYIYTYTYTYTYIYIHIYIYIGLTENLVCIAQKRVFDSENQTVVPYFQTDLYRYLHLHMDISDRISSCGTI